jgi:AcrR family transcriptional regulator
MADAADKREQLREERRRQIVEAAMTVFSKKGFHAANVSDVAAEAGVSQGTIYWYFDSKDELLKAALLHFFSDFGEVTFEALEHCQTAAEKLQALGQSMELFAKNAEGLFTLFLSYWSSSSQREEASRWWIDMLVEYKDLVVGIVEEGVRSGEFRPVDAEALVWAVMAAYDGLAAYLVLMPEIDLHRVNQAFIDALLNGLSTGG